jgi:hypothetical protein
MWAGREVLLVDEETLLEAGMQVGGMKENITVRGLGLGQSEPGARFRVGADLVFEVGQKLACVGEDPALTGKRGAPSSPSHSIAPSPLLTRLRCRRHLHYRSVCAPDRGRGRNPQGRRCAATLEHARVLVLLWKKKSACTKAKRPTKSQLLMEA